MPGADKVPAVADEMPAGSAAWEKEGVAPQWTDAGAQGPAAERSVGAPGWLATAAARQEERNAGEAPSGGVASAMAEDGRDVSEQEAARKEWLQYHLQVGEWNEAQELVVTARNRDLDYCRERALRK